MIDWPTLADDEMYPSDEPTPVLAHPAPFQRYLGRLTLRVQNVLMDHNPEPVDSDLIELLRNRNGIRTDVTLKDDQTLEVWNIAWGNDFYDPHAHVSTNISPRQEGWSFDFFFTHQVIRVTDPEPGKVIFEPTW